MDLLDRTIGDILSAHPETRPVFTANGFGPFAEEETVRRYGGLLRLRTALKAGGINPGIFCGQLAERMETPAPSPSEAAEAVNLFGLLPCPLKVPVEEAFQRFLPSLPEDRRRTLRWCLEGNANKLLSYYDYVEHLESPDELPDIVISPGFNSFFHRRFVEKFIDRGVFASPLEYEPRGPLAERGIHDPQGYTLWAMNLLVFAVDHRRLGTREVPRSWVDLLRSEYRRTLAIRGQGDHFCETLLMSFYREFGTPGVEVLAANTRYGWHPAQMVKAMVSGREDAPAVSILPLFFARNLEGRRDLSVIWPEDGALVSPVTLLAKADRIEEHREVLAFLTGPEVGRICAGVFFPSVHPEVQNPVPAGAGYRFVGWDWIRNNDILTRPSAEQFNVHSYSFAKEFPASAEKCLIHRVLADPPEELFFCVPDGSVIDRPNQDR